MNRLELLNRLKEYTIYNLGCYSKNNSLSEPKEKFEFEWNEQQENLEIIEELLEEEKSNSFHLYTSIYNLKNNREERHNIDLAYLENRKKGISCYLTIDGFKEKNIPEYMLVFCIHSKNNFEDEYQQIYTRDINEDSFSSREKLKEKMKEELEQFDKFIECDKKTNRFLEEYYDDEETEEFE